jgi:hypothetical protein
VSDHDVSDIVRDLRDADPEVVSGGVSRMFKARRRIDLTAPEVADAILDVLRDGSDAAASLADFVPHTRANDDAFLALARLPMPQDDTWSIVPTACAYLAASPSIDHARFALDWLVDHLAHGNLPRFYPAVSQIAETLVGGAPELAERAWPAILAFLDAGPSTDASETDYQVNEVYREVFKVTTPQLPPDRAWAIARIGLGRLDPVWGSYTRYTLASGLARHAAANGTAALDEVMAVMERSPDLALGAIISLATHPAVDRAAALSRVVPALSRIEVTGVPSYCTLAAAAVRALAPDADPATLGLPSQIAAKWKAVGMTEAEVCRVLSQCGVVASDVALRPASKREPQFGRDLVEDVLARAGLLHHFDAESGFVPVPYDELLETLAGLVRGVAIEVAVNAAKAGGTVGYELTLAAGKANAKIRFDDGSDYFDVSRVLVLFDDLLGQLGMVERFTELSTSDQTAMVMWGPPVAVKKAAAKLGLKVRRR